MRVVARARRAQRGGRGLAASRQIVVDALPEALLLLRHPVNQAGDGFLDLAWRLRNHFLLKLRLDLLATDQVRHAAQPHRLVEEAVATVAHLQHERLDGALALRKGAGHVVVVRGELRLDGGDGTRVLVQ